MRKAAFVRIDGRLPDTKFSANCLLLQASNLAWLAP